MLIFSGVPRVIWIKLTLKRLFAKNTTIFQEFDQIVRNDPKKILLSCENVTLTTQQVQQFSYKVANYFASKGYKKGDVVGILMENCAEYVPLWLGLSRVCGRRNAIRC